MEGISKGKSTNMVINTWERCKSVGRGRRSSSLSAQLKKSKSWTERADFSDTVAILDDRIEKSRILRFPKQRRATAPAKGCFSVYVGPRKQRFSIKTEYANHPLFVKLLEEAENEYGFMSGGPLALPSSVDSFCKVLSAISGGGGGGGDGNVPPRKLGCGFAGYGSYHPLLLDIHRQAILA